jgi:DNA-directed RNA polymerase alpha subunit
VQFPIETARRDLSEKLMEAFTERVTIVLPKNLQEFKELIDKDQISSILMGVFLKFLPVSQNPEYAITYIVRFEDIIRLFNKEIDAHMRNIKITDLTFRERSPNDLRKFLIDTFGDVVRRSVDEMRKTKKFDDIETSLKEFYMEQKNI